MTELLRNAWQGWFRVTGDGKVMALFLVSLLFLWLGHKQEKQKAFLRYGTVSALCCIVPVTAAALMLYQTRFYDYEWIWSIVPVTIVTAYAGTKALAEYWQGFRREAWRTGLPVTAGLLAAAFLCGGLSGADIDRKGERAWRERTENILEAVGTGTEADPVCMWAPRKIMEYARRLDGSVLLPYGRNMWEEALGAYSYDIYPEEIQKMYQWMSLVEETCVEGDLDITYLVTEKMEEQKLSTAECLDTARRAGVGFLILPENTNHMLLNEVTDVTGVQPEPSQGYYVFRL
ncbi:MAG: hypothetical protein NC121_04250 [Blautia sp.]|nr:hypothetical protein [Blautia sp.]